MEQNAFLKSVSSARFHLGAGGILAYPTETVWGLGVDVRFPESLERLFDVKGRESSKAVSLLVRDVQMAKRYGVFGARARRLMDLFWPGPLTLVVPASSEVPRGVTGGSPNVGLRCSSHPWVKEFMKDYGFPITTTSANRSGEPAARAESELAWLPKTVKRVPWQETLGAQSATGKGSTVIQVFEQNYRVLREGDLPLDLLERVAWTVADLTPIRSTSV